MKNSEFKIIVIIMLFIILFFTLLGATSRAQAGEVNILLGSYHLPQGDHCEVNPGIGYTTDDQLTIMLYKNSECNIGAIMSKSNKINELFSYSYGGALGYDDTPVLPFISINMKVTDYGYVGVIPGALIGKDTVFFYGVKF